MADKNIDQLSSLVFNPSFRDWAMGKEGEDSVKWSRWVEEEPERKEIVELAKAIIYSLGVDHNRLTEEEIDKQVNMILEKTSAARGGLYVVMRPNKENRWTPFKTVTWAASAALVVITAYLGWNIWWGEQQEELVTKPSTTAGSGVFIEQFNETDTIHQFYLADGSSVKLYPGSKLQYHQNSIQRNREVYLTGKAFFEIKRNVERPFLVHTKNIVTSVLGTSFYVRAFDNEPKSVISVVTGKVSVIKQDEKNRSGFFGENQPGTILTPNQEAVYDAVSNELKKTVIQKPVLLPMSQKISFEFSGTPITEVFKRLESAYGVRILFDEETMKNCSLSASLGNEEFFDKMKMVCTAINASYELIDGSVLISSRGCNN